MKWRRCAQKVAEVVFVTARNRIDRMGGFHEFMKSQKERMTWDDSPPHREDREEREDEEDKDEEVEDEFTMEIMLRMAGVDEKLIGWDRDLNNFIST